MRHSLTGASIVLLRSIFSVYCHPSGIQIKSQDHCLANDQATHQPLTQPLL